MDIPSNSQLVPYHQGPNQIANHTKASPRGVPAEANPAVKRYAQMIPPRNSRNPTQSDEHEPVYHSTRRHETQKNIKVGLLIDIYT